MRSTLNRVLAFSAIAFVAICFVALGSGSDRTVDSLGVWAARALLVFFLAGSIWLWRRIASRFSRSTPQTESAMAACSKCGKQLRSGDKFCSYCHALVSAGPPAGSEPEHTRYVDIDFLETDQLSDDDLRELTLWFGSVGMQLERSGKAAAAEQIAAFLMSVCARVGELRLAKQPVPPQVWITPADIGEMYDAEKATLIGLVRGHAEKSRTMCRPAAATFLSRLAAILSTPIPDEFTRGRRREQ